MEEDKNKKVSNYPKFINWIRSKKLKSTKPMIKVKKIDKVKEGEDDHNIEPEMVVFFLVFFIDLIFQK